MSVEFYSKIRTKYGIQSSNHSSSVISLPPIIPNVVEMQINPLVAQEPVNPTCSSSPINPNHKTIPESDRVLKHICPTYIVKSKSYPRPPMIIPVLNQSVSASITTGKLRDATLLAATDVLNPNTRFSKSLPPVVPPPWFLQVPRTRASNEPYARQRPLCFGPSTGLLRYN